MKFGIEPLRAPLVMPFGISRGAHTELDSLQVRITLANGVDGIGEAAIATHITGETVEGTRKGLLRVAGLLRGRDASALQGISELLHASLPGNMAAVAAVEIAIFDALARSVGVPLWNLFGGTSLACATDITVVIGTPEQAEARAKAYAKQGFKALKIKIGREKALDAERVTRVARAAPRAALYLDANQAFTVKEMVALAKELRNKGIRPVLIEQPVPKKDLHGLQEVWKKTGIPVCADESAADIPSVKRLLQRKLVPVINIKLMKFGMMHARMAAYLARDCGVELMIGQMMEGPVATLAAAHLASGLGCFRYVDLDTLFFIRGRLGKTPYLSRNGTYRLSRTVAGIGTRGAAR